MRLFIIVAFFTVALLAFLAFAVLVRQDRSEHHESYEPTETADNRKNEESRNVFPNVGASAIHDSKANPERYNREQQSPDWVDLVYKISSPILVVITLFTLAMVYKQVDSLKNIERAWIVLKEHTLPIPLVLRQSVTKPEQFPYLPFRCVFTNSGKTPARITECRMQFGLTKRLPEKPDYGNASESRIEDIPKNGRFIAPGGEFGDAIIFFQSASSFQPTGQELSQIISGELVCYAIARVLYRDAFNHKRETRVCFVWHVTTSADPEERGFLFGGPPEYNKHT